MKHKRYYLSLLVILVLVFASFQSKFFEIAKQIEIYNSLFKELNIYYVNEINPAEITNKAIKNTLKDLDPYTRFYNEQDVEDAKIRREGEYGGIGISVYYHKQGITITEIYEGFAADKAGLKAGDLITTVNGESIVGLENEQLSTLLKGIPDSSVSLIIQRQGKPMNFNLTLDKVEINPVPFYEMITEDTGYIVLTRFNLKASSEVKKAYENLKAKGMKKLVFDLRSNPGGSLFESIRISNFFLPKGKMIVQTKGKLKKMSQTYNANNNPIDLEMPIVVLINGRSASASEIVSGALQDYDRAVIMGERSFGKGLVQRYFNLTYGTQLKATISKYYTPSGRCIQELDYANRDAKTGEVPKFSEKGVQAFTTENGRTVYDGGGIMPDVSIGKTTPNEATKKLLRSQAIFNFAALYSHQNRALGIDDFRFSEGDFKAFKNYLKTQDTTFVTQQERLFQKAYKAVKQNRKISSEYSKIKKELIVNKLDKITKNKDILMNELQDEVLVQNFYKKGLYRYHLKHDTTILDAVKLLGNTAKYQQLLSAK